MKHRITRNLLAAAALIGATASSKAYNLGDWYVDAPSLSGVGGVPDNWTSTQTLELDRARAFSGVYLSATTRFYWDLNDYEGSSAWVNTSSTLLGTNIDLGTYNAVSYYYGPYPALVRTTSSEVLPLGTTAVELYMHLDGNWGGNYADYGINVYERSYQVARTNNSTGTQGFGYNSAFQSDNYDTSSDYGTNIGGRAYVARNVLRTANSGGGSYASASFVNGSFETNTAAGVTQENMSDVAFNAAMTGVVATGRAFGSGEVDIYAPSLALFGTPPDGSYHIAITAQNDSVALALASTLVQGSTYNLKFDYNYFGLWGSNSNSPLYVYGASTAGGFDTLLYTLAAGSATGQWLTADFTFVAGANVNYIGVRGDSSVTSSWIALDNFRFNTVSPVTEITGSVVRNGDIVLGAFGSSEGLYAKDGGWLDIRGDLTVGANGTVYIREGEITSDVYTQYNNTGTGYLGRTNFEASLNGEGASGNGGILSVRQHFAQDMYATGYETLGFRDGATNARAIYIDGDGFQGGNGAFGSLRSITGSNVQDGNIGIGWNGSQYTTIGVDEGSTLTINGRINGVNGTYSNSDKDLVLNVASRFSEPEVDNGLGLILNGDIRSSVRDVIQTNTGFVTLNVANAMSGSYYVLGGAAFVHHNQSLGANTAYATSGGVLVLDARNAYPYNVMSGAEAGNTSNLTVANDIEIGGTGFMNSGALLNLTGDNTITGTVVVGTNGYVGSTALSDATITVANGTHLTVSGLDANKDLNLDPGYTNTLTIETQNGTDTVDGEEVVTIGTFTNTGSTGLIDKVIKEGDGDAYLGTAGASLLTFEVNGGRLFIDSLSTEPTNFGTFQKDGTAVLIIQDTQADGVDAHYGRYNVNAGTLATASGAYAVGDVYVYATGVLGGKGTFDGDVSLYGGKVAPGFSPGILTVAGDYINNIVGAGGGTLDLELAGTGGAGAANGNDQLRVTGDILLSNAAPGDFSIIRFTDIDGFEAKHGQVFQVIADASGNARNTFDKFDLSQTVTAASDRVLFDHSTGKAYGTGLTTAQNFSHYGTNRNQREIGRALWMEAIDYDKSGTTGELPQSFIDSAYDPVAAAAKTGLKAWILTNHTAGGEQSTDLGAAAVQMLTAGSGAEGLDSLSPEAYSGFSELAVRLNRNFALLGANGRRSGDDKKWGFNVGYIGEQVTSDSTSDYTSYKASSDTAYVTADLALGTKAHLNLSAGLDDGRVQARRFSGDTNTAIFGAGLGITPESRFARFDLGASFSTTDLDAVRQGSYMSQQGQEAYAVSARVTFLPKDAPVNAVARAAEGEPSKLSLIPYVGVSYASTDVDAFSEANVDGAQLNVAGFKRRSLIGELGMNAEYAVGTNTTLTGVVAYEHEFHGSGRTNMTAEFADIGVDDTNFSIRTDGLGTSIFRLGVGLRQQLGAKASVGLGYDALLGGGVKSGQQVKADVSFRF